MVFFWVAVQNSGDEFHGKVAEFSGTGTQGNEASKKNTKFNHHKVTL